MSTAPRQVPRTVVSPREILRFKRSALVKNNLERFRVDDLLTLLVYDDGIDLKIYSDLCPHMGAPVSQGEFCRETNEVVCPWHGYRYSLDTGCLTINPNESIWVKPLAPEHMDVYKTPLLKLRQFYYSVEGEEIVVEG